MSTHVFHLAHMPDIDSTEIASASIHWCGLSARHWQQCSLSSLLWSNDFGDDEPKYIREFYRRFLHWHENVNDLIDMTLLHLWGNRPPLKFQLFHCKHAIVIWRCCVHPQQKGMGKSHQKNYDKIFKLSVGVTRHRREGWRTEVQIQVQLLQLHYTRSESDRSFSSWSVQSLPFCLCRITSGLVTMTMVIVVTRRWRKFTGQWHGPQYICSLCCAQWSQLLCCICGGSHCLIRYGSNNNGMITKKWKTRPISITTMWSRKKTKMISW